MFYFDERPLTNDEVQLLKADYENNDGDEVSPFDGFCLCLTIQAQQQEIEQLKAQAAEGKRLFELYHQRFCGSDFCDEGCQADDCALKELGALLLSTEPVDYHNPADTERINKLEQDYKDACKGRMIFFEEGISKNERIQALVADKDQQAGTIMRYEAMLKEAQQHLTKYRKVYGSIGAEAIAEKIDALLGGAEDGSSKDE